MKNPFNISLVIFFLIAFTISVSAGDNKSTLTRKINISNEEMIEVNIEFGVGILKISPGNPEELFFGKLKFDTNEPSVDYSVYKNIGRLSVSSDGGKKKEEDNRTQIKTLSDIKRNVWDLKFSPQIPIRFDIELGAAENKLELGSLKISKLSIECGASSTYINFSEPNPVVMETFEIEAGVSKLHCNNLLNSNFKIFRFEGGVGDYEFDVVGEAGRDAEMYFEVGAASTKINIDKRAGFKIRIDDSFLSSVSVENAKKIDEVYISNNYQDAEYILDIKVDTGVGSFKVYTSD
ncbi:MAG: toast rack family protein [Calditrichaceae bacterium]